MFVLKGVANFVGYLGRKTKDALSASSSTRHPLDEDGNESPSAGERTGLRRFSGEQSSMKRSCSSGDRTASLRRSIYDPTFSETAHSLTQDYHGFTFEHSSGAVNLCLFYSLTFVSMSIIAFSFIFEKWSILDSVYFAVVTFTTVGYGDLAPTTQGGRLYTTFFGLYGLVILGVFLGIIGHTIGEMQRRHMKEIEKKASRKIIQMFEQTKDKEDGNRSELTTFTFLGLERDLIQRDVLQVFALELPVLVLVVLVFLFIGWWEGWTFIDSLYFGVISFSSVGYGDIAAKSEEMRLLLIFFLPFAAAVFGEILGRIANLYIQRKNRQAERAFLKRSITLCDLRTMDVNKDGLVSKDEFLKFMLVALQKVDKESLDDLCRVFDSLDVSLSGMIGKEDLQQISRTERRKLTRDEFHQAEGFLTVGVCACEHPDGASDA
jgi:hypothetical protein